MKRSAEKFFVILTDFITLNLAWIVYFIFRVETGWFEFVLMPEFILPMLIVYFYWLLIFVFVGMYRTWFALSRLDELSTLFKSTFVGIFILFFVIFVDDYSHDVATSNRILIFIYWGILFGFVGSGRLILRGIQRKMIISGIGRRKGVIVGYNSKSFEIYDELASHPALGIDIIGFVAVNEENLAKRYKSIAVLGLLANVESIIKNNSVNEVIICIEKHTEEMLVEIISRCEGENINLKIVPHLYEILSGYARTTQLYGLPLIDINPQLMPEWEKKVKRILDLLISFIILIITLPFTMIIAVAIKFDSSGPILFKQERTGLNGKIFNVYKFRSMRKDAEKLTGPIWSTKDDPRVTRVGKFIRKIRMDELPQMINIFKGEMSLVGPRPERPFFVEKLAEEIPYYKRRLRVRPGLTGWAQVKHKYDESIEDVKAKLRYDLFYIENISLSMDLKILFRTIFVVMFGKGHYD